jgi:hypothetical protein
MIEQDPLKQHMRITLKADDILTDIAKHPKGKISRFGR